MPQRRNYNTIFSDGKRRIEQNTPVNNFNTTGTVKALLDIEALEFEKIYDNIEYIYSAIDPTRANGLDLDKIGSIVGSSRAASNSASDYTTTNFFFYVDTRLNWTIKQLIENNYSLSEIDVLESAGYVKKQGNLISSVTIPKGTIVSNSDSSITYTTIEDVDISESVTEAYVGVIAVGIGADYNVQSNMLISNNLLEIPELRRIAHFIKCSNRFPITNGTYSQTDSEYRYNVSTAPSAFATNELAIRRAALSVPGVRDILFERNKLGNGTVSLIVDGISPIISKGLVTTVAEKIRSLGSSGDVFFVNTPKYLGVEINFNVVTDPGTVDTLLVRDQARNAIIQYINDLPIGGEIVWNEIISVAMNIANVIDFVPNYFKYGEYDEFNKINKKQIVLNFNNQQAKFNQKWYCDSGLISCCVS